jgi:hypothetical protein
MNARRQILLFLVLLSAEFVCAPAKAESLLDKLLEAQSVDVPRHFENDRSLDGVSVAEPKDPKETFKLESRLPALERYPCSNCHQANAESGSGSTESKAHWNVALNHAPGVLASCEFCHDRTDPSKLTAVGGERVDLEHAYILCEKCHYNVARDWRGGAHGKRIGNYTGLRVIRNCTGCHNPHSPKFPVRVPKTKTRFPGNGLR